MSQWMTYCIVGLPQETPRPDPNMNEILRYSIGHGCFHTLFIEDMWRLMTPGEGVTSSIINWYAHYLSLNQAKPGFCILQTDFFDKLMMIFNEEGAGVCCG